jgi:hypothetical protein
MSTIQFKTGLDLTEHIKIWFPFDLATEMLATLDIPWAPLNEQNVGNFSGIITLSRSISLTGNSKTTRLPR